MVPLSFMLHFCSFVANRTLAKLQKPIKIYETIGSRDAIKSIELGGNCNCEETNFAIFRRGRVKSSGQ